MAVSGLILGGRAVVADSTPCHTAGASRAVCANVRLAPGRFAGGGIARRSWTWSGDILKPYGSPKPCSRPAEREITLLPLSATVAP
ncbi:hypothetical protein CS8_039680 [Cupriavidus sp. 8B]